MKSDRHKRGNLPQVAQHAMQASPIPSPALSRGEAVECAQGSRGTAVGSDCLMGTWKRAWEMGQSRATPLWQGSRQLPVKQAQASGTSASPGAAAAHTSSCASHLLGVTLLARGNGNLERLKHLPPKTQLACKRARGSGEEATRRGVQWLGAWTREPDCLDPDPTTHQPHLCQPQFPNPYNRDTSRRGNVYEAPATGPGPCQPFRTPRCSFAYATETPKTSPKGQNTTYRAPLREPVRDSGDSSSNWTAARGLWLFGGRGPENPACQAVTCPEGLLLCPPRPGARASHPLPGPAS